MKIATWNVNSLRARADRVEAWLRRTDVDVLAIQETKCKDENFPWELFENNDYEVAHFGLSQWNGVAIASRVGLEDVERTFVGQPESSARAARIRAGTAGVGRDLRRGEDACASGACYVPNGRALDDEHMPYKLQWLDVIPSQTTTMVGCCLIYATSHNIFSGTETPPTNPAPFTELYDTTTPPRSSSGYLVWNSSGATGTVSITTDTASRGGTGMIALRPVVANTDMAGTVVATSDVIGATPQVISKAQGTVAVISGVMGAAEGGSSGGSAGSKHDQLQETLIGQGYTTGSLNDRLYARERDIYNAGPKPGGNGPFSLMDYMRFNGTDPRIL